MIGSINIATLRTRAKVLSLFKHKNIVSREELLGAMQCTKPSFYQRLQRMREDKLIILQTVPHPDIRRSRIIGAEITRAGRDYLQFIEADVEERKSKIAPVHPCGQSYRVCYMSSKCYLRHRCEAAVID